MPTINPYLNFSDTCEEAFNFYKSVFGGEFQTVMRYSDGPPEMAGDGNEANKIIHIALPIGSSGVLMGSDRPASFGPATPGDFSVMFGAESEEEGSRIYTDLSAGGQVIMPYAKAFWGSYFGMFRDKFGTQWMVSYDPK